MLTLIGGVGVAHALFRLHRPGWRDEEWWRNHPLVSAGLAGPRTQAHIEGLWAPLVSAAWLLAGVLVLIG